MQGSKHVSVSGLSFRMSRRGLRARMAATAVCPVETARKACLDIVMSTFTVIMVSGPVVFGRRATRRHVHAREVVSRPRH